VALPPTGPAYVAQLAVWTALARWTPAPEDDTLLRPVLVNAATALARTAPSPSDDVALALYGFLHALVLHRPECTSWLSGITFAQALAGGTLILCGAASVWEALVRRLVASGTSSGPYAHVAATTALALFLTGAVPIAAAGSPPANVAAVCC
jgi:hypothetical protein